MFVETFAHLIKFIIFLQNKSSLFLNFWYKRVTENLRWNNQNFKLSAELLVLFNFFWILKPILIWKFMST